MNRAIDAPFRQARNLWRWRWRWETPEPRIIRPAMMSHFYSPCPQHFDTQQPAETTLLQPIKYPDRAYTRPSPYSEQHWERLSILSLNECCTSTLKESRLRITRMALSKSQRIMILLAIDGAFFLVELIIGGYIYFEREIVTV